MKESILAIILVIITASLVGCAVSQERQGQRLFAGCLDKVDDYASLKSGQFVCEGERDPAPFAGNGRSCGDCHMPGDNFGLSVASIAKLPLDHPLFYSRLDENPGLLRDYGLVHVVASPAIDEFRQSPKLVHLQRTCDEDGNCDVLGLLGDRIKNLCAFTIEAIGNHMSKTTKREAGKDFRVPTDEECEALIAYMVSDLVAGQDERNH